ncbi:MAG TPA: hypothetical protein VN372_03735 [Methanospirillum sp.]|nr:hypothetical protein [Methanospirillum sp.]
MTSARQSCGSVSSTTRGIFAGGSTGSSNVVTSDYITIASVGNASNFGSLSVARQQSAGCSSPIIGLICGGYASGAVNVIDYFTITTLGDALDFGDLTAIRNGGGCCSSPTRGIYAGGQNGSTAQTNIDIFGLVTTSTATNFGNLSTGTFGLHACSSHVKGTLIGGYDTANLASMQALNFATAGVLSTFGNLITARRFGAACSNSHGGLA